MERIKVFITGKDLRESNYLSNSNCALAKALKRKFPNDRISVGGDYAFIGETYYSMDEEGSDRISRECGDETIKKGFSITLTKNKTV